MEQKSFDLNKFSSRLKELRTDKGISTKNLCVFLGVGNNNVSNWETGKQIPSIEMLFKIAIFFNISSDYLIGIED